MSAQFPKPDDLIAAYVGDVMKHLPMKQRNDVGFELRALLGEELRGRAADAGRLPDEAMTLELLQGFGRPDDVAARYHPPGVPIIPPQQTVAFAWTSLVGVALQWAVTLPMAAGSGAPNWIGGWWTSYGLGAFWWPGFLVSVTMVAAFVRLRWPAAVEAWKPKLVDRDHINRPMYAVGLGFALLGVGVWVALAWWATTYAGTNHLAGVFEFDAEFLATRAPLVLLYWAATIALFVVLIIEGRWRSLTRRIELGLTLALCALLMWIVFGGRVFVQEAANATTEGMLVLLVIALLAEAGWKLWRGRSRIRTPVVG